MLVKNVSQPIKITVGNVEVYLFSIGERKARIGVSAPHDVQIEIGDVPPNNPEKRSRDR